MIAMPVLEVENLHVRIGGTEILRGVTFQVERGRTLGVVGESGCGKSMTGLTLMGMLPGSGSVTEGAIRLDGEDLTQLRARDWLNIRGQKISMVMQDPFTSLNPLMRVGDQIAEVYRIHQGMGRAEAATKALEMIRAVGVPSPESSARKYPHQMSGGQRQRIVIAIAFASHPQVLIADEPTTALDVTLQAQILRLLNDLQEKENTAVIIISHDIGVIGSVADDIAVYYAGRIVEIGPTEKVIRNPQHPYTQALLAAMPRVGQDRLAAIGGQPPNLANLPHGCSFAPRCPHRFDRCDVEPGLLSTDIESRAACWLMESSAEQRAVDRVDL